MSGYVHETCEAKIYCHPGQTTRCLCHLSNDDVRQKFLDPALVFVRGKGDNRIVHFIQPNCEPSASEYRSNFSWPDKTYPAMPYIPQNNPVQYKPKSEVIGVIASNAETHMNTKYWGKGIAEKIFEK